MKMENSKKLSQDGKKKRVLLAVTGGISAYKSAYLARLLTGKYHVRTIMTEAAEKFIGKVTFHAITGEPVLTDIFPSEGGSHMPHIEEASNVDIIVIAPSTADTIARIAGGRADNLLSAVVLASTCPVLLAPAMNPVMWQNPVTRRNIESILCYPRFRCIGPVKGEVACGDVGEGRMVEPQEIARWVDGILAGGKTLAERRIVVTAGPTIEEIDPVRYISNVSTGKMGYTIAREAVIRGAKVTLISGPCNLEVPFGVEFIGVRSADEMHDAVMKTVEQSDVVFMSAAVADWKPRKRSKVKISKSETGNSPVLELSPTVDILSLCVKLKKGKLPLIFGFCLETEPKKLIASAKEKLAKKGCDYIVANLASESVGKDKTSAVLITAKGQSKKFVNLPKEEFARILLDIAAQGIENLSQENKKSY